MWRIRVGLPIAVLCLASIASFRHGTQSRGKEANASASKIEVPKPISILEGEIAPHRFGEREAIRTLKVPRIGPFESVELEMVVDTAGKVVSAEPVAGPSRFYEQAVTAAKQWEYIPFQRDGHPVFGRLREWVAIVPPERRPNTHVPFPHIRDWNSLRIALNRTGCSGPCPVYDLEIRGDGAVLFDGKSFVAVAGRHESTISQQTLLDLLDSFHKADYLSLDSRYVLDARDLPTSTTLIAFDQVSKSVVNCAGEQVGMPAVVSELENKIDHLSGVEKWLKGNAETGPALMKEGWNFQAGDIAHRSLLARAARSGDLQVIRDLIAAGAPIEGRDETGATALEHAAQRGELELVRTLLEVGAGTHDAKERSSALRWAAATGRVEIVRLLLSYGASPHYRDRQGISVLMAAAASGVPEMVGEILKSHPDVNTRSRDGKTALMFAAYWRRKSDRAFDESDGARAVIIKMLLDAGADLKARDHNGETALFSACFDANAARALIKAGADVNVRNKEGETPLMQCNWGEGIRLLVDSGAQLSLRDLRRHTALDLAKQQKELDKVAILEAAAAKPGEARKN
jgi:ankyrin repeat protein